MIFTIDVVPAGTVVVDPVTRDPCLVTGEHLQRFTFDGWERPTVRPRGINVEVPTPPTSVAALANGFLPRLHPTAAAGRSMERCGQLLRGEHRQAERKSS